MKKQLHEKEFKMEILNVEYFKSHHEIYIIYLTFSLYIT